MRFPIRLIWAGPLFLGLVVGCGGSPTTGSGEPPPNVKPQKPGNMPPPPPRPPKK